MQCRSFKYLGITFSENLNWNIHVGNVWASATKLVGSIIRFFYTKGGLLIDPVIKIFNGKVIPHLLYGAKVWGCKDDIIKSIEAIQNLYIRWILALPKGSPMALMRAELGIPSLRACIHLVVLKLWKRNNMTNSSSLSQHHGSKGLLTLHLY